MYQIATLPDPESLLSHHLSNGRNAVRDSYTAEM
jgi:hypothetical protein